jgi:hypothetical protein
MVSKTPHEWSTGSLLAKAQRYAMKMHEQSRENWEFGFWSALCMEMIVRAAVARSSPALLADGKDWTNIAHAIGVKSSAAKTLPKSIDITDAVGRAQALYPAYTRELGNFSVLHVQRRNAELHSGALAFDDIGTSWLPQFYASCEPLLAAAGSSLTLMFGDAEAATANTLIQALKDDAAKAVQGTIHAHQTIWQEKNEADRQALADQAASFATRWAGHRVICPACGSPALVHGTAAGANVVSMENDLIVTKTTMLPSSFECKACALKISGYSKLSACGLGGTYTSASNYDPVEYFGVEPEIRYIDGPMDEDNNEP